MVPSLVQLECLSWRFFRVAAAAATFLLFIMSIRANTHYSAKRVFYFILFDLQVTSCRIVSCALRLHRILQLKLSGE